MNINFRPIRSDDFDFLWRLHIESLKEYVEKTWGWDGELQRTFIQNVADGSGQVIVIDGFDAGVWHVVDYEDEILLSSVRLLPRFQNRGIATKLIGELLKSGKPIRLQVLKVNPARRLYERLGFRVVDETETHFKMIRTPW